MHTRNFARGDRYLAGNFMVSAVMPKLRIRLERTLPGGVDVPDGNLLSPSEARQLAALLVDAADQVLPAEPAHAHL